MSFVAAHTNISGILGRTVHEPCTAGGAPGETMTARIEGRRADGRVHFVKSYESANPNYAMPVCYAGRLGTDAAEIAGAWTIPGAACGTFLTVRAGGTKARTARKAVARA